jgi:hypothetical protein
MACLGAPQGRVMMFIFILAVVGVVERVPGARAISVSLCLLFVW